jgi:transcription antitermination factor NusG
MERNWYAVYTKPNKEKKVVTALTKKGIKNYCPLNNTVNKNKSLAEYRPLFNAYVFVYITPSELAEVKNTPYVNNFVYYKSSPAVIKRRDIDLVKKMTSTYVNIRLEKRQIDLEETAAITCEPAFGYDSDVMTLNYETVKITLPSIGYSLTAVMEQVNNGQLSRGLDLRNFMPETNSKLLAN